MACPDRGPGVPERLAVFVVPARGLHTQTTMAQGAVPQLPGAGRRSGATAAAIGSLNQRQDLKMQRMNKELLAA